MKMSNGPEASSSSGVSNLQIQASKEDDKRNEGTMTKKISKVIVYYTDGTFEEMKADASPHVPSAPDFRPDTQKIRDWPTLPTLPTTPCPWPYPWGPNQVWCDTSTGNAPLTDKYTITSTGNGNVDISRK